jgi:hypothetical protein
LHFFLVLLLVIFWPCWITCTKVNWLFAVMLPLTSKIHMNSPRWRSNIEATGAAQQQHVQTPSTNISKAVFF